MQPSSRVALAGVILSVLRACASTTLQRHKFKSYAMDTATAASIGETLRWT